MLKDKDRIAHTPMKRPDHAIARVQARAESTWPNQDALGIIAWLQHLEATRTDLLEACQLALYGVTSWPITGRPREVNRAAIAMTLRSAIEKAEAGS